MPFKPLAETISQNVKAALAEDIGTGDITAQLIPANQLAKAKIITREAGVFCGKAWVEEVFSQLDPNVEIDWKVADGAIVTPSSTLFELHGNARSLLTGERAALNFVQTLSAVATQSAHYATLVRHTHVKLLDTRKTIPGLRDAQKYAVSCGGCHNHRIGLYDAFLIKENHIAACGGIGKAIQAARQIAPSKLVEVEVENFPELEEALEHQANIVMLDNFSLVDLKKAVLHVNGRTKLEASGNINLDTLIPTAETGVDYISIGALTKHIKALDLSMRIQM